MLKRVIRKLLAPRLANRIPGKWVEIGGKRCFFRSGWEIRYAQHLAYCKRINAISDWSHEPKTFWFENIKRGVRSYKPDFKIMHTDGTHSWVEVKGYMDPKSRTKLKRMAKYYPQERIVVIDKTWFAKH